MRYLTPLRYPGGKAKLAPYIAKVLEANGLLGCDYVEPYAGGAGVGLFLLLGGYVERIHINDIDPAISSFWHSVLHETDGLCRLIRNTRVSVAEWRRQRAIQLDSTERSMLERGFAAFFLNRTNRSGIIRSGGMIGGALQQGPWKLNARYNKAELITRIERIARNAERISLHRLDATELLLTVVPRLPRKSFVYLDPPYYVKGKRRLYANYYNHEDHVAIAREVGAIPVSWIVSYDDTPAIRLMYRGFRHREYSQTYTARNRCEGAEVMFFSTNLKIPRPTATSKSLNWKNHSQTSAGTA